MTDIDDALLLRDPDQLDTPPLWTLLAELSREDRFWTLGFEWRLGGWYGVTADGDSGRDPGRWTVERFEVASGYDIHQVLAEALRWAHKHGMGKRALPSELANGIGR